KNVGLAITFDARAPENLRQAVRLLDQAIAHDPMFLLAYCQLAQAHALLYFNAIDPSPTRVAGAEAALQKALQLGPDRGESHLAAAWVAYLCYRDYDRALTEVAIAKRQLPN